MWLFGKIMIIKEVIFQKNGLISMELQFSAIYITNPIKERTQDSSITEIYK